MKKKSQFTPLVLNESIRRRWQQDLVAMQGASDNLEDLLDPAAELAYRYLPSEFQEALASTMLPDGPALCLIDNLPIDSVLPVPPSDGKRPAAKSAYVSELALLGVNRCIGLEVLTFQQEKEGAWPQQVAPVTGMERSNSSASREDLNAHADNGILDRSIRLWISLIGLVNDGQTQTNFAPLDEIRAQLPPKMEKLLWEPLYRMPFPESFDIGEKIFKTQPILFSGPQGNAEIKFTAFNTVGITPEAEMAVNALKSVLPMVMQPVVLKPGTLCLFSNTRCLHSRGRIEGNRWAQRIYLCLPETMMRLRIATDIEPGQRAFDARQLVTL